MSSNWHRVTKKSLCPICSSAEWCSISGDGATAKCMRIEPGSHCTKVDKNGAAYFLHHLDGVRRLVDLPPPQQKTNVLLAKPQLRHLAYDALLGGLNLNDAHLAALRERGLKDELIAAGGYRSLTKQGRMGLADELVEKFGDKADTVPGIVTKEGDKGRYRTLAGATGLVVPCRDLDGSIVALKIRADASGAGSRYTYVSSASFGGPSPGSPIHCPVGTPRSAELVRLTEGELKADIAFGLSGIPTLSVPGVASWRPVLEILELIGARTIRLSFDADCWEKPLVARALAACAGALKDRGYTVELERWQLDDGKGIDDLLAAGKSPSLVTGEEVERVLAQILSSAKVPNPAAVDDESRRLLTLVEEGGAQALFRDRDLLTSLARLRQDNRSEFAAVKASIKKQVSARELESVLDSISRPQPAPPSAEQSDTPYCNRDRVTYRTAQTKDGPVEIPLCNFEARIVEDVVQDDGAEQIRRFALEGKLANGVHLPRTEVLAGDFPTMNWIVPSWGTQAVVFAGQGTKDHLRVALQLLSGDVPQRTVFQHIGWRRLQDGWSYLSAAGALGSAGLIETVPVRLSNSLSGFCLPFPRVGDELCSAVVSSLELLGVGPDHLTFPVLAAIYRSVLGNVDFGLHLAGPTGSFKSEFAALAQQHFGAGMDAHHLPANWSSTGNALEVLAFAAKDALLVVDDFCPTGSANDIQRYHREADRLFRGQGNQAGRQRLSADSQLRPTKMPRGMILSTGEDTPRGQSLRARLLVLDISPGDFGPLPPAGNPTLTQCQQDARAGKYSQALSGFLCWLAPRIEKIQNRLHSEMEELRHQARCDCQHARTPGIVADLALGLRYFLEFARECGAISSTDHEQLWERGWDALKKAGAQQADNIANAEPTRWFLKLIDSAIVSGRGHFAGMANDLPASPQRWGWTASGGNPGDGEWRANGKRLGWTDGFVIYLEPEASFAEAQSLAHQQGDGLPINSHTLWKRLRERGLLAERDEKRQRNTVRKSLGGTKDRQVIAVRADTLTGSEPSAGADVDDPTECNQQSADDW